MKLSRLMGASLVLAMLAGASMPANLSTAQPPGLTATERVLHLTAPRVLSAACCKTCRKGKACGNSCISRDKTCRKGVGCACDG